MSVGEYLALGMDEKGKAETASCGTDSPDTAGDAPPALDRGDSVDDPSPPPVSDAAKSLESIFVREALAFRARGGGCGKPLVHYMDGFTIEVEGREQKNKPKKEEPEATPEERVEDRKQSKNRRATPVQHPPRRRTNELELLLSMDFGPKDAGRRILDTEKRKSVLDKEKRLSSETGDEHDKSDHAEKTRTKQKKRSSQSTVSESPVKPERSRSSVDSSDTHSHSSKRSSGKHDKAKEKEKEREKELAVLNTPTVSMRMLPSSEDSPEDRCLYCKVSFKEVIFSFSLFFCTK
ncbi:unnamed protein product [Cylicostephanus goldi]|uniref:Uncharacterized protein n=1 Tax=Cylicostephanus goldi TaxID=71465 RepID=A0A3P7PZU2_CYLGO|nr:unnamed protein product [Cylicostephanus goldi]